MKHFIRAGALACLLTVSASGGEIPSGGAPQPQPQNTNATTSGEIPTSDNPQGVTDAVLSVILSAFDLAAI